MARLDRISRKRTSAQDFRKIGHNTKSWMDCARNFELRYHTTNVVQFDALSEALVVCHRGYTTVTTAQRIRHGLWEVGLQLLTTDLPGRWRVADYKGNAWTIRGNSIKLVRVNGEWSRHV